MNKKLIALAVAAATVAPAALAQSANPVSLYGRVYVMFENVKADSGSAPLPSRNRVSDQSSLLGVRGTEDLGGGIKAFFQLETVFRADSNTSTFGNRNSGVGLQGDFGSLVLGRWDTPFKVATIAIDPFGDLTMGGITAALNDRGNFDRREQNVVQYWTPTMSGFGARLSYAANEGKTSTINPSSTSISGTYSQGPIYLAATWEKHKDQVGTTGTAGIDEKGSALIGSFTFGPVKLGAQTQRYKRTNRSDEKANMFAVTYTAGKNQLVYSYQRAKDGAASTAVQPECKVNNVGYFYNFSRRTSLLAQYTKVDNNSTGVCGIAGDRLTSAAGNGTSTSSNDQKGFGVGFRHTF